MAPPVSSADLEFAVSVARAAGDLTLKFFRQPGLEIIDKSDGSPVTVADQSAEDLMRKLITERFPDDAILGEEAGTTDGISGRRWVIDPIDGTDAFVHGVALYTNLLYLEDEHGPAVGVINVPALGETVWAGRGLGCFFNGAPCHVSSKPTIEGSILSSTAFEYWDAEMLARTRQSGIKMRTWGDGFGYVLVASGRIEAMVDPVINFWDIAPCSVIIPEAGGRITTIEGEPGVDIPSCLATNGLVHDEVVAFLSGPRGG